ncbi:MAG: transposase [Chloroflexi bacterium]|nr:transposase [Chloroflexota bacterium]
MQEGTFKQGNRQGSAFVSEQLTHQLYLYTQSLLRQLAQELDRRLVKTFLDLMLIIVMHRHRNHGLELSELGGHLLGMAHAPAGTKRISNLLHSPRWSAELLEQWLWERGDEKIDQSMHPQDDTYVIWDESEIEKSESIKPERLCAVRSVKARRLKRIKKGYFNPPGGRPVFVPGFHWFQVVVTGFKGSPCLAHFHWWTSRGEAASKMRDEEGAVLRQLARRWGSLVVHVWDRGFAGAPWLLQAFAARVRFIVRWKKGNYLIDDTGQRCKASDISRRKRSTDHRLIYDCKRRCERKTGIVYFPVRLPDAPDTCLWMVVSRPGPGRQPWFLLTNEILSSTADAWRIVLGYNRRWQIETTIRFDKSELAIESIRLVNWQARKKLMLLMALVHSFLLSLLTPQLHYLRSWLFRFWCHRTGKRSRLAAAPLYRLRLAICSLWVAFRPFSLPTLN